MRREREFVAGGCVFIIAQRVDMVRCDGEPHVKDFRRVRLPQKLGPVFGGFRQHQHLALRPLFLGAPEQRLAPDIV